MTMIVLAILMFTMSMRMRIIQYTLTIMTMTTITYTIWIRISGIIAHVSRSSCCTSIIIVLFTPMSMIGMMAMITLLRSFRSSSNIVLTRMRMSLGFVLTSLSLYMSMYLTFIRWSLGTLIRWGLGTLIGRRFGAAGI